MLDELAGGRARRHRLSVPVLDRQQLPARLLAVLRAHGVEAVLDPRDLDGRAPVLEPADSALAAVSLRGADDQLVRLAGVVGGCRALAASAASSLHFPHGARALVLVDPATTPPSDLLELVSALDAAAAGWGMVLTTDPVLARFALLKVLLVPAAQATGRFAVVSGAYAEHDLGTGPSTLASAGGPGHDVLIGSRRDVLVLNGHANAFDASLGEHAVLCARAGRPDDRGPALLPCFNDGQCFRRSTSGDRRLVAVGDTDATVLVLSGCDLLPWGRTWFRVEAGLAHQVAATTSLAAIASSDVSLGVLELDLLTIALIGDGHALGDVVRAVNLRRREYVNGVPATTGPGPFVLLGNPGLTLQGPAPVPVPCGAAMRPGGGRGWHVDLAALGPLPAEGTVVRAVLPMAQHRRFLLLRSRPTGTWCRGIQHEVDGDAVLYAWVAGSTGETDHDGLTIDELDDEPWALVRGAVGGLLGQAPFWNLFLEDCRDAMERRGQPAQPIDQILDEMPGMMRLMAHGDVALRAKRGVLLDETAGNEMCDQLWAMIHRWHQRLLDGVVEVAHRVGRLHSYGAPPFLHLVGALDDAGSCSCGNGRLTEHVFQTADATVRRVEALCGACGGGVDDDGGQLVRFEQQASTARIGQPLAVSVRTRAPDTAFGHIEMVALVETWTGGRLIASERQRDVLTPGTSRSVVLRIDIPDDLPEGVHQLTLIAVVNGALSIVRRMIAIARPDDTL